MMKEAKARILINNLLTRSGWRFFDDDTGPANVALEAKVKVKKKSLDDLGDDFEKTANGYVDYLLLDARGHQAFYTYRQCEEGTLPRGPY